jgi:hypothetical protein
MVVINFGYGTSLEGKRFGKKLRLSTASIPNGIYKSDCKYYIIYYIYMLVWLINL